VLASSRRRFKARCASLAGDSVAIALLICSAKEFDVNAVS
jgi:hypothetical protein